MIADRRHLLGLLGASVAFGAIVPRLASAAGARDSRLIVIVLRGALDGLSAVPPVGDSGFAGLRGTFSSAQPLPLDGFFALHPAMPNLARQFKTGQAAIVHACATPYRDRSHFDGQDVLESGYPVPGHSDSGWLNRFLATLQGGQKIAGVSGGNLTPLILRGNAEVLGWAPVTLQAADGDLVPRLMTLYGQSDPLLAHVLDEATRTGRIAAGFTPQSVSGGLSDPNTMVALAQGISHLMAAPGGPRIAAVALEGWDTHASEISRLNTLLAGLDSALAAFETTLGALWQDTAIMVVTEFGRTVAVNGTLGTDHGTGTAAFLTGGAIRGGRVIADWPGLKPAQLYQARDLAPTTDLRAVCKGLLADLYGATEPSLTADVFPGSDAVRPMRGLVVA